jgi:zinc/manganese transport system permease protein
VGWQLAIGWAAGALTSALGLAASFALDLPTGATVVCTFGAALALAGLLHPFLLGDARLAARRGVMAVRWSIVLVLAASAVLIMLAVRADQPLLDAAEWMLPPLRTLYFTANEAQVYAEAGQYAERYRQEAERLNEIETRSRSQGAALDDEMVARMSSFLKSYGEMRRGEEFVMHEVRSRARERVRWLAGGAMFVLALSFVPGGLRLIQRSVFRSA